MPLLLVSCGSDKAKSRGENYGDVGPLRGRVLDTFTLKAQFTATPQIEVRDFGGAVLTTLTVPLKIEEGDLEVMRDVFWESARTMAIRLPQIKGCIPTLFGIDPKRNDYQLKFWGWDNVGVSTACENLIKQIPASGFEVELTDVKWADVGLVKKFTGVLKPFTP